ncbi:MAG TPA: sialidase family protein, partial [Chloroflexota bacterium]|nr:sialidase family protein [Chloroflexota bacterium]
AFDSDHTVFALWSGSGGSGVIRSTDSGAGFQALSVGSAQFTATSKTLSISPDFATDQTIAVTDDSGTSAQSYLSTNGGTSWSPITVSVPVSCDPPLTGGGFLLALGGSTLGDYVPNANAICSTNTDARYAISRDGGATWSSLGDIQAAVGGANNFDTQHSRMYAAQDASAILYTDQYGNAVRSTDGGATWANLIGATSGLGNDAAPGITGPGPYYTVQFKTASDVYAVHEWSKTAPGIFHSTNGGATWSVAWQGAGATTLHGVAAAGASSLFFAGGNMGLLRSVNLGSAWQPVGTFAPQTSTVALSPSFATDHTIFTVDFPAGTVTTGGQDTTGFGIYRSTDGGATWSEPKDPNPVNDSQFGTIYTTAVNGGLSLAVSPAFASDRTVFEGDRIGTVVISRDGGATWTAVPFGTPPQEGWYLNGLALSPGFGTDHTAYIALGNLGFGVVRSTDGGQTWKSEVPADRFGEIADAATRDIAISREQATGLIDMFFSVGFLYNARDNLSSTTAPEWSESGSMATVASVALSPNYQADCTVYASMWGGPSGISDTLDDGVYVSTNACAANPQSGFTWTKLTGNVIANGQPVRDFDTIVLSPNFSTDQTLFIGSYSTGVYESTDRGQSWSAINTGLGNLRAYKLALAATGAQTGVLFAATDAGVWQTPVSLLPKLTNTLSPRNYLPDVQK